ncbi:MAG: Cys-Gln thioester bond-forming surface protein [bacterium]|nr:Cys-Gln thioester bond-forming surface protein [bacterium]
MKHVAKIIVLVVIFSSMTALTTHALSLVGTRKEDGGLSFTRQVTGVHGGEAYENTPGGYATQLRGDDGALLNDGKQFMAFCIEPGRAAHDGKDGELRVQSIPLEEKAGGIQAAWLVDNFYDESMNTLQLAALQMAIWEVITDTDGDYDLATGDFKMWGGSQEALDIAYSYLVSIPEKIFDAESLDSRFLVIVHPQKQDLIVQQCCCSPVE